MGDGRRRGSSLADKLEEFKDRKIEDITDKPTDSVIEQTEEGKNSDSSDDGDSSQKNEPKSKRTGKKS